MTATKQAHYNVVRAAAAVALVLVAAFVVVLVGLAASGDSTGPQRFANDVFAGLGSGLGAVATGLVAKASGIGLFVSFLAAGLAVSFTAAGWLARLVMLVVLWPIVLGINWVAWQGYSALTGWLF